MALRVPALSRILADLHPIVFAVFDFTSVLESLGEEFTQVVVIGSVFEAEVAYIREILVELLGETFAQVFDGSRLLLLSNLLVLLLVRGSLETLPRKTASEEVHENMTQRFQVITSGLFASKMGVDAHVARSARE